MSNIDNNLHLQGNFSPIADELDIEELKFIQGQIPQDLRGVYLRNGPNPAFSPLAYVYPLDGDGMLHAIYFANGKASYKNRYVQTRGLQVERRAGKALYGSITNIIFPDVNYISDKRDFNIFKNTAHVSVQYHDKRYLALWEGGYACEVNRDLETLGLWAPNNHEPLNICGHVRKDEETGDLYLIGYSLKPPYLTCYVVDRYGALTKTNPIDLPRPVMIHDFAISQNYIILCENPAVFNISSSMLGSNPLQWQPEHGSRIGLLSKKDLSMRWFDLSAYYAFHYVNAFEEGNSIIIDYIHHSNINFAGITLSDYPRSPPSLWRINIDLLKQEIKQFQLDERVVELPRIHDSLHGQKHRYIYCPVKTTNDERYDVYNAIAKYDLLNEKIDVYDFGAHCEVDEAIFVCKNNGEKNEDDGYLMLFVYDKAVNNSYFVILDAKNVSDTPVATLLMPRRVPHGTHGLWVSDD